MELKEGIKQINQSVSQSSASDATLEGYMLELKDANGNLVDKQPVSKLENLVYNYLTTKRQSELADAMGGNQYGNADGFVKFINTHIDDTIDNITPMGVFPYIGDDAKDRGFVFRFYSDKHTRSFEIKVCEKSGMFYRSKVGRSEWSIWESGGMNNMGVLSESDDLDNVKNSGVYIFYTEKHPSNTPSGLLPTTTTLLKVTVAESVTLQELFPLAGEPYFRIYYKNNYKWYDWQMINTNLPSFYKDYPDIASLSSAISLQPVMAGVNDNVFIMYHRKSDNYSSMVEPRKWSSYQNSGEIAEGVIVVEGGKILVIAPTETSAYWSSAAVSAGGKTTADRSTALGDFEGKANTASQITHSEASGASYAAGYCAQYSRTNANGQGLTAGKWWLPSLGELMMIYANKNKINYALSLIEGASQLSENWYWSSTEYNATSAWYLNHPNGSARHETKDSYQGRVRAVSAFIQ